MANIYKDGVYYVNGKALNPPAVDPYEQMRKVGIDPNYKPSGDYQEPEQAQAQSVPMVNTPSPTNPGLPTGLSAPNQAQAQQVPVTTPKPTYTNVALQGDIPLGQLAQIGANMPAGTTEQTPGFLGIMTNAVQQATAPAQTATALDIAQKPTVTPQTIPYQYDQSSVGGMPATAQPGLPNELAQMLSLMPTATGQQTQQFMPTAANSALSNQLSAKATDLLNRDYGYTAAEQQAFRDSAMSQFNRTQDEDLRRLEALYEQYGLNSGAGELGGQAGSSLQDYFGKRAQAQADIETGLQTYFAQKKSGDEQAAIQTATAIQNQIYNQVRGDYQDMLSYLQVNETIDNNAFQRAMSLAGFQSEEAQRDFLNQLGISDRESQDYWMGVETAFNQQMQGAEFNAAQTQQQFTNQMTAAGFDAQQSQWLFENQATLAELASQMTQQEFENTMTAAGFTAQQAQAAFNNSMNVNTTNFEQQITSQNLADQGLQMLQQMVQQGTISASDYMNLVAALTQGEQKQFTTAMNNDQNQTDNLLLPLTLMMNLLSQNANTGVNVNVNGGTPGNGITEDSVKNWLKDKLGISDKEEGYFDEFYRWIPGKKPTETEPLKEDSPAIEPEKKDNPILDTVKTISTLAATVGWGKMFYEQFQNINAQQKGQHAKLDDAAKEVATVFTEGILQRALPQETEVTPVLSGLTTQLMGEAAKSYSGAFNAGTFAAELFLKNKDADISTPEKQQALANSIKAQIENTVLNDMSPGTMEPGYWGNYANQSAVNLFGLGSSTMNKARSSAAASFITKYIVEYSGLKGK